MFYLFYFQAVVISTTTEDGEAPHLDAELSTIIPVLEDTSSTHTRRSVLIWVNNIRFHKVIRS